MSGGLWLAGAAVRRTWVSAATCAVNTVMDPPPAGHKRKQPEDDNATLEPKPKQRKAAVLDNSDLDSVQYYFENGMRKVKPYFFEYRAYAKGRWMNRPLLDVLTREFQDRDEKYYRHAIESGLITLNGERATPEQIVKANDVLGHKIHRHEPVATDKPIDIIHRDEDMIVINKPGGIPVHPSGRYRHNTVIHVLRKTLNIPRLYPANRLDRPTSGLMLIGLNAERARQLESQMTQGLIRKEYICRVEGEFPEGEVVCEAPIKTISHKLSLNYTHEQGKECKTVFEKMSYNGKTSVVRCRPLTGRTHQIRVHLRYLGYPIANDLTYGNHTAWAPLLGKGQLLNDSMAEEAVKKMQACATFPKGKWEDLEDSNSNREGNDPLCPECGLVLTPDPRLDQLFIWLHAWRYSGDGWSYETELPDWAQESFTE